MEEDIRILEEFTESSCCLASQEEIIECVKNLIKGYRELEEKLKREKIWRIRLEKENEDTCNEVNNNYIRKSLVVPKSKIKEILERYGFTEHNGSIMIPIKVLQELMEDK